MQQESIAVYDASKLLLTDVYKTKWDNIQKQYRRKIAKHKLKVNNATENIEILEEDQNKTGNKRDKKRKTQIEIDKTRKIRKIAEEHIKNTQIKLKNIANKIRELRKIKAQRITEKLFHAEKIAGKRTHKQLNTEILELLEDTYKPIKEIKGETQAEKKIKAKLNNEKTNKDKNKNKNKDKNKNKNKKEPPHKKDPKIKRDKADKTNKDKKHPSEKKQKVQKNRKTKNHEGIGPDSIPEEYERYEWDPKLMQKTDMQPLKIRKNCGMSWEKLIEHTEEKWKNVMTGSGSEFVNGQCTYINEAASAHIKTEMKKMQKWAESMTHYLTKTQWQGKCHTCQGETRKQTGKQCTCEIEINFNNTKTKKPVKHIQVEKGTNHRTVVQMRESMEDLKLKIVTTYMKADLSEKGRKVQTFIEEIRKKWVGHQIPQRKTENVIYMITKIGCRQTYIGETKNSGMERWAQHRQACMTPKGTISEKQMIEQDAKIYKFLKNNDPSSFCMIPLIYTNCEKGKRRWVEQQLIHFWKPKLNTVHMGKEITHIGTGQRNAKPRKLLFQRMKGIDLKERWMEKLRNWVIDTKNPMETKYDKKNMWLKEIDTLERAEKLKGCMSQELCVFLGRRPVDREYLGTFREVIFDRYIKRAQIYALKNYRKILPPNQADIFRSNAKIIWASNKNIRFITPKPIKIMSLDGGNMRKFIRNFLNENVKLFSKENKKSVIIELRLIEKGTPNTMDMLRNEHKWAKAYGEDENRKI